MLVPVTFVADMARLVVSGVNRGLDNTFDRQGEIVSLRKEPKNTR
jgi:hypothetical protein